MLRVQKRAMATRAVTTSVRPRAHGRSARSLRTGKIQSRANAQGSAEGDGQQEEVQSDSRLGLGILGVGAFLWSPVGLKLQGLVHMAFGGFLTYQAWRIKFRIGEKVEVYVPGQGQVSQSNYLQGGGASSWKADTVQNWELWYPGFPILCYFKETDTSPEGQVHFFPVLSNGLQLYKAMYSRLGNAGGTKPSPEDWSLLTAFKATPFGRAILANLPEGSSDRLERVRGLPLIDQ